MSILFKDVDILIRNKDGYKTLHHAYLGVKEDKISYISKNPPKDKYDTVKKYSNHLLIPGLVNAHGHSPMTLLRGVGGGLPLHKWLFETIVPIEDKMTPYHIYVGCSLAILEMLAGGTTCFSEMYDFPYASVKAIAESGIRANVTRSGLCVEGSPNYSSNGPRFNQCLDFAKIFNGDFFVSEEMKNELNVKTFPSKIKDAVKNDLIRGDLCIYTEYMTTPEFVKKIAEFNKDKNLPVQMHVAETKKETVECIDKYGLTPIQYFYKTGILDNGNAYAAHCCHVNKNDLDIMKKTNTSLITNPTSNMKLASGFAPIRDALDKGVNVGLGTDGCSSNNNLDMFEEMHVLALIQSGYNKDSNNLSTTEIFDMATIGSARAMHRNDIGQLKVGYKADIVAIDLSKPHLTPNLDTLALLVYSAHSTDVSMTMVNGNILYEEGKYFTLNKNKIYKEVEETIKFLYNTK